MEERTHQRNLDAEFQDNERKYAYDFDEVLRRYIVRGLEPYFIDGSALEIGCFKGDFTKMLLAKFDDVSVIEGSARLVEIAKAATSGRATFHCVRLENAKLDRRYDNVFLVHTLEHFDDPVGGLVRVRSLISERGRLFIVVPNANAPSRQIAVKMGLISHNAAVTAGEAEHGHRTTYSFDTLTRDVKRGGLTIERQGGIFFKPLANVQFDAAVAAGVVSPEYLEGCFELGFQYPDLCASIYLVCGPQ